ncbi:MAG: tetratricopeptide repeat protein, partial [bacterium]
MKLNAGRYAFLPGCLLISFLACQHYKYRDNGLLLLKGGRYYDAVYMFNQSLKNKPDFARGYYYRGLAYCGLKDLDKALADFNKAVELDDEMAEAYVNRGIILATRKKTGPAMADFNKALELDNRLSQGYANRAGLYYLMGKEIKAEQDFSKAISLDPENIANYANRGDIRMRRGDIKGALSDFKVALKKDESPKNQIMMARLLLRTKDYRESAKYANRAIDKEPRNLEAYIISGKACYRLSRYNLAALQFSRAIGYDPKPTQYPEAYFYRGMIYYRQNRLPFAR